MSWAQRLVARLADRIDEFAVRGSEGTREFDERVARRDARRQVRDEIAMGEVQPRTWVERGWAEHAHRKG